MSHLRFQALAEVNNRKPVDVIMPSEKISDFYGKHVFNEDAMLSFLPEEAYNSLKEAINNGVKIDRKIADQVASAMKNWSMTLGATHYTHWFQPLTGTTAEKHDAFIDLVGGGRVIERFDGSLLVQQEPDASSFPNGGIRNTFEARGYTAWDPTSPAFIVGKTLCIPTIFVAYTGEALDNKTPLLRALHAVDEAATDVCQYFDKNITKVVATLGWEQEYFLIDSALYNARPDLVMTGRTLFGHASAKGQQLDDHYFGTISSRALAFMRDFEIESNLLGIPVTTRHNEVAPNQFECAPIFEETNLANDHNQLLMDLMDRVAERHNFRVLVHEKPFKGVNGSGKHNNWSLGTNTGKNLLSPGKTPKSNLQFLTFFVNTIMAVHNYDDLLRASIATASNEHRLGANEAPPAIVSLFIGSQLSAVLDEIEATVKGGKMSPEEKTNLKLNVVGKIPDVLLDNTDRNRTSPFAFTGNKFEFRAVGSTANCAIPMTVLNSIVAKQLKEFKKSVDALIETGLTKDEAIFDVLRQYIQDSKRIRFEGDGYGDEWVKEAESRGLKNEKETPNALDFMVEQKVYDLYSELGVMTPRELDARHEILLEQYKLEIQIESRISGDLVGNHIIPTAIKYQNTLIENVRGLKDVLGEDAAKAASASQVNTIIQISESINSLRTLVTDMTAARKAANAIENIEEMSKSYSVTVKPYLEKIRVIADKLELMVDDEVWPLPKYREMLFAK
ncbi:MAG: glutamine synthetase III [Flavobacteriales bacterium]